MIADTGGRDGRFADGADGRSADGAVRDGARRERAAGRVWTVRLGPHGGPSSGTVRLTCSRPGCADELLPDSAAGRRAATAHVNAHLARVRAGGGPRGDAWCGCRAADCAWHSSDVAAGQRAGARRAAGAVRCGGPVVLTVYADRAGRLWRVAEVCARCAAATRDCRVLDTAPPPPRPAPPPPRPGPPSPGGPVPASGGQPAGSGVAAVFSHHASASAAVPAPAAASGAGSPGPRPAPVPGARAAAPRKASRRTKKAREPRIAQRVVPPDLRPEALRAELVELGDAFRDYQRRPEPDLALLAELHERKARAFARWADVTGDDSLRDEAHRAEKAVLTTLEMHRNRIGITVVDGGPAIARLLTRGQAAHARAVLEHVGAHSPCPGAEAHLAVLMLTLRAARAGVGNITGQDLTGWLGEDAERVLRQLADAGWLRLPGTVAEVLAARPEDPAAVTVPTLLPGEPRPFSFGKVTRARLSGWAQRVVGDRKLRKKKADAATRLLALYTAAHTRPDGRLGGAEDEGLDLGAVAAFCAVRPEDVIEHAELLIAADWLTEADTAGGRLHGRLAERVLPLGGLL
ncbi:hypothetical protein ABTX99_07060 [Streptomyces flaveolus]|uniref:hypothetical protein n=1 Tax=Streptomyces flaveolus TaxID=67297 RepID=UPI0033300145